MATYPQTMNRSPSMHTHSHPNPSSQRRLASKQRFLAELSQCLFDFVIQLLPTQEELAVKEDVRKLLERLIRTIEPESRLLSFGSTANGFSLRNSDMDLCCLIDSEERLAAADLVNMLGDLLERETKFHVKPLPHARIPIVKLSLDPSPGLPLGIACDIGFENRLALENTRLLMCYALIDPTRVRTMVLFLKVWCKRRKINSPYKGTLSSYGYVLLVLYFLIHVKNPPVLPNLQQIPPLRPISPEDTHIQGFNTWFFDDIALLRQRWQSTNTETVAELLIDFFKYYSRDFPYNVGVVSIRSGLIKKESKGWQNELDFARYNDSRERNRFCIEDPFETDFNVARCVTKDGLYTIRGEFMRASRIFASRPERAIIALAQLCEERKDEQLLRPVPPRSNLVPPARLPPLPPQSPYSVGSNSLRPKGSLGPDKMSPQPQFHEPLSRGIPIQVPTSPPPEHMAPRRGKWTSPPPPEAPAAIHASFEAQLGKGLALATSSTEAREAEACTSSSNNSEILTDDEHFVDLVDSDDVRSVRSFTEEPPMYHHERVSPAFRRPSLSYTQVPEFHSRRWGPHVEDNVRLDSALRARGRLPSKQTANYIDAPLPSHPRFSRNPPPPPRLGSPRRASSGQLRSSGKASPIAVPAISPSGTPTPVRLPIITTSPQSSRIFYETTATKDRPILANQYPTTGIPCTSMYRIHRYPVDPPIPTFGDHHSARQTPKSGQGLLVVEPTPTSPIYISESLPSRRFSHSHSHSASTITPTVFHFAQSVTNNPSLSRSPSHSPSLPLSPFDPNTRTASPLASASTASISPTSSTSSHYAASASLSPSSSPPSPPHSPNFPPSFSRREDDASSSKHITSLATVLETVRDDDLVSSTTTLSDAAKNLTLTEP